MLKIPSMLFRGGTSKGPFFLKSDLPTDITKRDNLLLKIMGSPDPRQIDGIGGGDSLTSKVAIVAPSQRTNVDLDYLFCQVHVEEPKVETALNCGNMLSAVAPFAIMRNLIKAKHPETHINIYNENTGVVVTATVQTPDAKIKFSGGTAIDGVPGTAAPIKLSFKNPVGAKTGKLLPSDNVVDEINGIPVSFVDVALPMLIVPASALGKTGYESKKEFDADTEFLQKLETLREAAAKKMGLGDVSHSVSPKICIVSPPKENGTIHSCYFTPFSCHAAHAVSGAFCLAAACFIEGTVANQLAELPTTQKEISEQLVKIEHVSGRIDISIKIDNTKAQINFPEIACIRTARPLFNGEVLVSQD